MNTARIKSSAFDIERLSLALKWLREYGHQLDRSSNDSFAVNLMIHSAGACHGAEEAKKQLEAMARLQIEDLVNLAIVDAENTIEMCRAAIREECA